MDVAETYYANSSYSHIEAMTAGYFVKLSSGFEGANFGITDAMHNATMNFLFYLSHTERQCEKKNKKASQINDLRGFFSTSS